MTWYFWIKYMTITALSVLFTFVAHEFAHWLAGTMLDNPMGMTLNAAFPLSEAYLKPWHALVVTAAGPVITLLQALLIYFVIKRSKHPLLYPLLLTPLVMRSLALFMNLIQPNDEGRISEFLGWGLFTLPVMVCGFLFILVYKVSGIHWLTPRFIFVTVILIITVSSVLILSDQAFHLRVI